MGRLSLVSAVERRLAELWTFDLVPDRSENAVRPRALQPGRTVEGRLFYADQAPYIEAWALRMDIARVDRPTDQVMTGRIYIDRDDLSIRWDPEHEGGQ